MELINNDSYKVSLKHSARSINGNKRTENYHLLWDICNLKWYGETQAFQLNSKPNLSFALLLQSCDSYCSNVIPELIVKSVECLRKGSINFAYYANGRWEGRSKEITLFETVTPFETPGEIATMQSGFILRNTGGSVIKRYLLDDKLRIKIEISLESNVYLANHMGNQNYMHIGKLLADPLFSDVTINVGEEAIPAHKCILSIWSPVFKAMFSQEMKESKENKVFISDFKPKVIKALLEFMYRGQISDASDIAEELMMACDKYQLDRSTLFPICEEILSIGLSVKNACTTLVIADLYQAEGLKIEAARYALTHIEEVTKTEGWQAMKKTRPDIVFTLMESIQGGCKHRY